MKKKKILITGSVGFIGSNLVRKITYEKLPYSIIGIDKVSGNPGTIYIHKDHTFYIADIRDQHIMDVIFKTEKPDVVLHLAAESSVDKSLQDPNSFITSNVLGTQIITNCCVKYNCKLIYSSTDECLGSTDINSNYSWTEEDVPNPRNPYSASKLAGELIIRAAHATYGLNYNITRSCNNYGPRQTIDKLIPRVIKCLLANNKVPVYGTGQNVREWIAVDDNCSALLTILEKAPSNETYNVSSNCEISNLELVQKICNLMKKELNIEFVEDRKGHDLRYSVNSEKLRKLDWKPAIKFADGLAATVDWYVNNQWSLK